MNVAVTNSENLQILPHVIKNDKILIHKRKILTTVILSIITLGLYDFYWAYLQIKNVRALKEDKSSCIGETLCFLLVPFYSFYWFYTRGQYLYSKFTNENRPVSSSGIAFLLLDIFGLRIIALSIMQSDFNRLPYGGDNGNPDTLFIILMLAYPVLQFAVFFIYVNLNTVKMSFEYLNYNTGKVEINGYYYRMFFYELVNMDQMKIGLKNSLLAMLNNIFVMMPLGVICGYFFYKKVPCSAVFKVIFFIPNIISIVVLSMVYKYMFDPTLGPIAEIMRNFGWEVIPDFFNDPKYAFPLILLYCNWAGVGYNTLVLSGNINKIPKELIEYGQLEGLGMLKEIWLIVVPCIWPIISTMIVTGSMAVFTFFIQVQIFTGGNADTATIAFIINGLVAGGSQNLEKAAAFGICCTLFAAPMLIIIKKLTGMIYQDVEF